MLARNQNKDIVKEGFADKTDVERSETSQPGSDINGGARV